MAQRQELAVNNRLARKVESFVERVREGIDSLDFDQRQRLLRLLVEQVRVTGPKVEIHLRIPLDEPLTDDGAGGDPADGPAGIPRLSSQVRCVYWVEVWFSQLTNRAIRRGSFAGVGELVTAIHTYIDAHNIDPRPFVWTASVECILEKVNRCRAISRTDH